MALLRHQNGEAPSPAASHVVRHRPSGKKGIPTRWTAAALAVLEAAYRSKKLMKIIEHEFSTDQGTVHRFARQLGWPRRRRTPWSKQCPK